MICRRISILLLHPGSTPGISTNVVTIQTFKVCYNLDMKSFSSFDLDPGLLADYSQDQFPTRLYAFRKKPLELPERGSTFYGFIFDTVRGARARIEMAGGRAFALDKGMYFCSNEPLIITDGIGIAIERLMHNGMFMMGGPVEKSGRLKYIDGCTDSLLIPPVRKGDPCLNSLHFPESIDQTMHAHPSMRLGIVSDGGGICITPDEETVMYPGQVFGIHTMAPHKFRTGNNQHMTVVAYHPDSDFGPEDENHPMLNRTSVDGVVARDIPLIRTK